jgi:phenylpropionate dioxygenase-like ring-hydroxylating dioxygenase large terminal subunit
MFVYQHQLRHVLRPDQYYSAEQHQAELDYVFLPGWHFVGTTADLPRPGAFRTLELLGRPVLLRNMDGRVHAFENVCAHRHCLLTHQASGWSPQLKCQYHGWEYTAEGRTGRIPEAQCFRPFDRENARLRKYRLATCGELIFVSLADDGPSLTEYLEPFYEHFAESFAPPYRQGWTWEVDFPCNWKVIVENSLESYHIPCVHPRTFKELPTEDNCQHDLDERYTSFRTEIRPLAVGRETAGGWRPFRVVVYWFQRLLDRVQRQIIGPGMLWGSRKLGGPTTNLYTHHHIHPNLLFSSLDVHRMMQAVVPTSPTSCRVILRIYPLHGTRWGLIRSPLAWFIALLVNQTAKNVLFEDAAVFTAIQKGMQHSEHPGVIGTREERIFVFQEYLRRACATLPEPEPAGVADGKGRRK